jgi:DNA-binding winged helix-turn-helix (wHTH) protein
MEGHAISFGPFRLLAAERLLLESDKPVRLGSRAFDILVALIERAGELVAKEELVAKVWPNIFVEESSSRAALDWAFSSGVKGNE